MNVIKDKYRLREVDVPTKFLGSNIKRWSYVDENGLTRHCWALGSETYVKQACIVAESQMKHTQSTVPQFKKASIQLPLFFCPILPRTRRIHILFIPVNLSVPKHDWCTQVDCRVRAN